MARGGGPLVVGRGSLAMSGPPLPMGPLLPGPGMPPIGPPVPDPRINAKPNTSIFVGDIPPGTKESEIRHLFSHPLFGTVTGVKLVPKPGASRWYAFVNFEIMEGKVLAMSYFSQKEQVPLIPPLPPLAKRVIVQDSKNSQGKLCYPDTVVEVVTKVEPQRLDAALRTVVPPFIRWEVSQVNELLAQAKIRVVFTTPEDARIGAVALARADIFKVWNTGAYPKLSRKSSIKAGNGNLQNTLVVTGLLPTISSSELEKKFSVYGKILSCRVKRLSDAVGIGWMEDESYEQAQTAQREMCGVSWGTRITVKFHRDGGGENYDPTKTGTSNGAKPVVTNGAPTSKTPAESKTGPASSQPIPVAPTPSKIPASIPAGLPPPQAVMPLPPHAAQPPVLQRPPQQTAPPAMPVPQPQLSGPTAMHGAQQPPVMRASLPWIPQVPILNTDKVKLQAPIPMQPPPKEPVVIPARDTRVGIGRRSPRSRSPRRRRSRPRSRERRRRISPPTSRRRSRDRRSPVRERDRSRTRKRPYSRRASSRPLKRSRSHSPPPARRSPVSPRRRSPVSPRRAGSPVSRRIPVSPQPEYDTRLGLPRPPLVRIDEAREKEILYGGVNGRKPRSRSRGREIPRERSRDRERSRRDRERDRHRSRERVRERSYGRDRERDRIKKERSPDYLPTRNTARPRSAYDERRSGGSTHRDAYEKPREPYSERRETYDPPREPYDKPRAPPLDRPAHD